MIKPGLTIRLPDFETTLKTALHGSVMLIKASESVFEHHDDAIGLDN